VNVHLGQQLLELLGRNAEFRREIVDAHLCQNSLLIPFLGDPGFDPGRQSIVPYPKGLNCAPPERVAQNSRGRSLQQRDTLRPGKSRHFIIRPLAGVASDNH
jgi:hypothetical protein